MLPRLPVYLNRVLEFLPDRLDRPKWRARCPIEGIEPVRRALAERRRVLLAFPHFSLYGQLRGWLRAAGLPVACFTVGESTERSELKRHKDRWALLPEIPTVFHSDQLADALRFVLAGGPLLIALDGRRGRQLELPVYDGWTFRMATGPLRIAARHDATIFPCTMIDEGGWRFRIKIGDPAPAGLLALGKEAEGAVRVNAADQAVLEAGAPGLEEAAAYLFRQVLPHLERNPEQCRQQLLDRFSPSTSTATPGPKES